VIVPAAAVDRVVPVPAAQSQTATNTGGDSDAILEFENLTGTNTFDILRGDGGPNVITGLNAADGFQGKGGDDTLIDPSFPVDKGGADYSDATGPVTGTVGAGHRGRRRRDGHSHLRERKRPDRGRSEFDRVRQRDGAWGQ
jgi:hypothetical protein